MLRGLILAGALVAAVPAFAEGSFRRVTIVDGDTVILPLTAGFVTAIKIRMLGIDAPETRGRCLEERQRAAAATARLEQLTASGVRVVTELDVDSYGRFLGRLYDRQGRDLSAVMIAEGHARPLADGEPRRPWCPPGAAP